MSNRSCSNCDFFHTDRTPRPGTMARGQCRSYPPVAIANPRPTATEGSRTETLVLSRWPVVNADDWCGEFSAKPPTAKPTA